MPLSAECKRILAYASEEAEGAGHNFVGTEHLAAGMLRERDCYAAWLLNENGVDLAKARAQIAQALSPICSAAEWKFLRSFEIVWGAPVNSSRIQDRTWCIASGWTLLERVGFGQLQNLLHCEFRRLEKSSYLENSGGPGRI